MAIKNSEKKETIWDKHFIVAMIAIIIAAIAVTIFALI